jgi:hypothetical protein
MTYLIAVLAAGADQCKMAMTLRDGDAGRFVVIDLI